MFNDLKTISKHTLIYGVGISIGTLLTGFILIPIYTRYLTPKDYGTLEIINVIINIFSIIFTLSLQSSLIKFYSETQDKNIKNKVIKTTLFLLLISSLVSISLLYLMINNIKVLFEIRVFLLIILLFNFTSIFIPIPYAVLRAEQQSLKMIVLSFLGLILTLITVIYFLIFAKRGISGVLEARILTNFLILLLFAKLFFTKGVVDFNLGKKMLIFSLPLIPASITSWVVDLSDRFFLQHFLGLSCVGIYAVGYKYASILLTSIVAFQIAWSPFLISIKDKSNAKELISRIITYYILIILFLVLFLCLFSKEIIMIITTPKFYGSYKIVFIVCMGYFFYGWYLLGMGITYIIGKTQQVMVASIIGAFTNILLNFLLIPLYGMRGAAIATFFSFLIMAIMLWMINQKKYFIPLEWNRIIKIFITSSFCFIFIFLNIHFFIKLSILVIYFIILVLLKFFEKEEIEKVKIILKTRKL